MYVLVISHIQKIPLIHKPSFIIIMILVFTKIADHRCENGSGQIRPYNHHFFYDYNVALTGEGSAVASESTETEPSESSWDTSRINKLPPLRF